MKFEIIGIERRTEDDEAVGLSIRPVDGVIPDEFEVGAEVEAAAFDTQPDLARFLGAVSEARKARECHERAESGSGAHHEDRALDLLLGQIDP